MGTVNSTDYSKQLQFVQNLTDDNFGQVQIFRNEDAKFVMKCIRTFITGDKRHSDFKKILDFMRVTKNNNVAPLLFLEQQHQSNVCIQYEKVFVYTEYLNFSLKGLIVNNKNLEQAEIWYCLKSMLELIRQLESNHLKINFSLENIFLTLKGIPSIFLYHLMCDEGRNNFMQSALENEQQNQENNYFERSDSMHLTLTKTLLQLFNMQIVSFSQQIDSAEFFKNLLFQTCKKNPILGNIIKKLLVSKNSSDLLDEIKELQESKLIKISSQIRLNKFRYVVSEQQKSKFVRKDLQLNQKDFTDDTSKPMSNVNTPIYRLRQNDFSSSLEKSFKMKNTKTPELKFFKDKLNNQHQKGQAVQVKNQINSSNKSERSDNNILERPVKSNSMKGSSLKKQTRGMNDRSKLSIISKNGYFHNDDLNNFQNHQQQQKVRINSIHTQISHSTQKTNNSIHQKNEGAKPKPNQIRNFFNEEIMKNKSFKKNIPHRLIANKTFLNQTENSIKKNERFSEKKDDVKEKGESEISYKPILTEQNIAQQQTAGKSSGENQKRVNSNSQSKNQSLSSSKLRQSVNMLDKLNFLSTLELKKYKSNMKVQQIVQKKDMMLSRVSIKSIRQTNDDPLFIKQYSTQLQLKKQNISQGHCNIKEPLTKINVGSKVSAFEKKKMKVRTDKNNIINEKLYHAQKQNQNNENTLQNVPNKVGTGKLRKLSIKAKQKITLS